MTAEFFRWNSGKIFGKAADYAKKVYDNAQKVDLIIGIVAGLDLTKHEKLLKYINEFRTNFKR